ncbi:hypothetical protein JCM10212_003222 [Sporobolomyces blumeae]
MSRAAAASKRPAAPSFATSTRSSTGVPPTVQTTPSTSHTFHPSPLDAILAEQGLNRYRLEPPSWRAPWIPNDAAGKPASDGPDPAGSANAWPVFYPTRDGMDEDQLTEAAVKSGYTAKLPIQADTFSAHGHVLDNLKAKDMLGNLSRLVTAVQARREANLPTYGPSTFRLPSRITLTDSKRETWFSDLANPSVPLSKLSRSVPHGYKGEKGLDMLSARKVEVSRAVWFVRAFGGVEIQSLAKSRPVSTAIAQYTQEFTTVVCEFVRKQLLDLALPEPSLGPAGLATSSAATHSRTRTTSAGLGASVSGSRPQSDFADPEARKTWKDKFDYTLNLLTSLLSASLLATPQFIRFIVSLIDPASTTPPQLSVAVLLVEEYWHDILEDEPNTARLMRSCLIRLEELDHIAKAPPSPLHTSLSASLITLIRSAFLALPEAFVSLYPVPIFPSTALATSPISILPSAVSDQLESVLLEPNTGLGTTSEIEHDPVVLETIRLDLADLNQRRVDSSRPTSPLAGTFADPGRSDNVVEDHEKAQLELVHHLDNFAFPQSIASLHATVFAPTTTTTPNLPSAPSTTPNPSTVSPALAPPHATSTSGDTPRLRARSRSPILPLDEALPLLFTWATTPSRAPGLHRRYVVARLVALELERERQGEDRIRQKLGAKTRSRARGGGGRGGGVEGPERPKGPKVVENAFVRWVDERYAPRRRAGTTSDDASVRDGPVGSRDEVRALADELIRSGALSYGGYLQRMIARGETVKGSSAAGETGREESVHLWIIRTVGSEEWDVSRRRLAIGRGEQDDDSRTDELVGVVAAGLEAFVRAEQVVLAEPSVTRADNSISPLLDATAQLAHLGLHLRVTRDLVPARLARLESTGGTIHLEPTGFAVILAVFDAARDMVGLLQLVILLLCRTPPPPLLSVLVDVASARLDLWLAIDGVRELGDVLFANLESAGGRVRRRLVDLLQSVASAGYLASEQADAVARARQDLHSMPTVTPPNRPASSPPPVELQSLVVDSSPAAIEHAAGALCARYMSSPTDPALSHVVNSAFQLLPQFASIEPVVKLLEAIDDRLPGGIESSVLRAISWKNAQHATTMLGGPSGTGVVAVLSELVVVGVISLPTLVKEALLPIWKGLLASTLPEFAKQLTMPSPPLVLEPALCSALSTVSNALLKAVDESYASPEATTPPNGSDPCPLSVDQLLRRQCKSMRISTLFTGSSVSTIASLLAVLVLQQEVFSAAGLSDELEASNGLFLRIVNLEQFQALIVKKPRAFATGMLESDFVKSFPALDTLKPKLLAGLLLALKDGAAATPANLISTEDLDLFLSGLTIWHLAVSKVEVEASLERLELDSTLSQEEKDDALHTISNHFLERVCAGDGSTYLGEQVVKCYHGPASDELVSVAFTRLAAAVTTVAASAPGSSQHASAAITIRCTTRLLETLLQSSIATSRPPSLRQLLEAVKAGLAAALSADADVSRTLDTILLVVDVLDISLRCTDGPAEKSTVDLYAACLETCGQLALLFSRPDVDQPHVATYLLDTCSHLLVALPDLSPSFRAPSIHALIHGSRSPTAITSSSSTLTRERDARLPNETFGRFTRLFGSYAPPSLVPNPWELLDHSDSSSSSTALSASISSHIARRNASAAAAVQHSPRVSLTNFGPVDLAAFRARVAETIPAVTALDALSTTSSSSTSSARPASLASNGDRRGTQTNFDFETPCTGLSVQARDHRKTNSLARNLAIKFEQAANGTASTGPTVAPTGRKRNATVDSEGGEASTPAVVVTSESGSTTATTGKTTSASSRGTKRKVSTTNAASNSEVIVLDDEDDEAGSAKPAAKKGKTAASRSRKKPAK